MFPRTCDFLEDSVRFLRPTKEKLRTIYELMNSPSLFLVLLCWDDDWRRSQKRNGLTKMTGRRLP